MLTAHVITVHSYVHVVQLALAFILCSFDAVFVEVVS